MQDLSFGLNYDLWACIGSFLSDSELWELRHLNESLYDMALDARYRTVYIPSDHRGYRANFSRLIDCYDLPDRTHKIIFTHYASVPGYMHVKPEKNYQGKKSVSQKLSAMKRRLVNKTKSDEVVAKEEMMREMAKFTKVSQLDICLVADIRKEDTSLIYFTLKSLAPNLRSLTLDLSFDFLPFVVQGSITLHRLEELSIALSTSDPRSWAYNPSSISTTVSTIEDLVNNNSAMLQSIALFFPPFQGRRRDDPNIPESPDIFPLYNLDNIKRIPKLEDAFLSIRRETDPTSISKFLQKHSRTLRRLRIKLVMKEGVWDFDPSAVLRQIRGHLPRLEHLSITMLSDLGGVIVEGRFDFMPVFIEQYLPTIKTFCLDGEFFLVASEIRQFLEMPVQQLTTLTLHFQSLSAETMDLLSQSLPNIEKLSIEVLRFDKQLPKFENDFHLRSYPYWGLQHLNVTKEPFLFETVDLEHYFMVLIKALPNIKTFNGVERSKYLSSRTS